MTNTVRDCITQLRRVLQQLETFCLNIYRRELGSQAVKYEGFAVSQDSMRRLSSMPRKILVLDLDETLIHSEPVSPENSFKGSSADFKISLSRQGEMERYNVYLRPHVNLFLDIVGGWYELVVFTAGQEEYGKLIADRLDGGRNILSRRYYRHDCTVEDGSYTKDLSKVCRELERVFILDNTPDVYVHYPNNAIPIDSWFSDPKDKALLSLLPFLDALRFTKDVRPMLQLIKF